MNQLKFIVVIGLYPILGGCSSGVPEQAPLEQTAVSRSAISTPPIPAMPLPPGYTMANVPGVKKTRAEFLAALAERASPEVQKTFDDADRASLARLHPTGSTP